METSPSLKPRLLSIRPLLSHPALSSFILTIGLIFAVVEQGASIGALNSPGKNEKPYALLFGTVWGPDNRPIYGVKIKIRRENDSKPRWELYSDHRGEFAQRVPAGTQDYIIWPDLKGVKFEDGKQLHGQEVKVHVENDERSDFSLHLTY